jgi:hypothetical protein
MSKFFFSSHAMKRSGLLSAALTVAMAGTAVAKPAPPAPAPAPAGPAAAQAPAPAPASGNVTLQSLTSTAISALSSESVSSDSSTCGNPDLSQAFLSFKDNNWYTLAPGESTDSFDGTGWTLVNGASIQSASLADGQTGSVLDLPSGAEAISPPMCVASDYPTARSMVKTNGNGTQVAAGVFYAGADPKNQLQLSGTIQGTGSGFSLSSPLQVHPGNQSGWQMVQFIFGATGNGGDGQIYNFYVDPRMCH